MVEKEEGEMEVEVEDQDKVEAEDRVVVEDKVVAEDKAVAEDKVAKGAEKVAGDHLVESLVEKEEGEMEVEVEGQHKVEVEDKVVAEDKEVAEDKAVAEDKMAKGAKKVAGDHLVEKEEEEVEAEDQDKAGAEDKKEEENKGVKLTVKTVEKSEMGAVEMEVEAKMAKTAKDREADLGQKVVKLVKMNQGMAQVGKVHIKSKTIRERGTRLEREGDQKKPRSGSSPRLIHRVIICLSLWNGRALKTIRSAFYARPLPPLQSNAYASGRQEGRGGELLGQSMSVEHASAHSSPQ